MLDVGTGYDWVVVDPSFDAGTGLELLANLRERRSVRSLLRSSAPGETMRSACGGGAGGPGASA